ncbi:discoidin domain-containing protein [Pyxidicoccus caerfyrddinensis]|uniref:discoidin domain-containing protein n=1 Tax=Pyxidicoccus caerfyrddinensis TaxID=2709663 RepID=UPI0013DD1B9F|nr:discoidin domain-containing protein [Pyxidicoccus caerfyrddinensis]
MLRALLLPVFVFALLGAGRAWPNGGPVAWSGPTATGNLQPRTDLPVRLVSEDLSITVTGLERYRVRADYVLANEGAKVKASYGVPLFAVDDEGQKLDVTAGSIRISLAGRRVPCKVVRTQARIEDPRDNVQPLPFAQVLLQPLDVDGWCVAELTIPSGKAVPLRLEYSGELLFQDVETSKAALPHVDGRWLRYPLFPAGWWKGQAERVDVTVDFGPYAGRAEIFGPAGAKPEAARARWHFEKVDLDQLPFLSVRFNKEAFARHRQLTVERARFNPLKLPLSVTASSTLAGGRYAPAHVLDGRADTAWCEGSKGDGAGEWLEVRAGPPATPPMFPCHFEGVGLVAGYTRSAKTYGENGRPRRVRVATCAAPEDFVEVDLALADRPDAEAHVISESGKEDVAATRTPGSRRDTLPQPSGDLCLRLTFVEVAPGTRYPDTCVTELVPLYNCG